MFASALFISFTDILPKCRNKFDSRAVGSISRCCACNRGCHQQAWRIRVKSRFLTFCLYPEKFILALYKGHSWQDPYVASRIPLNCKKVSLGACLLLSGVASAVFRVASFEYLLTTIHRKFHMMNHLVMILASALRLVKMQKLRHFSIVILRRHNLSSVEN
jgi:hypothetical protein